MAVPKRKLSRSNTHAPPLAVEGDAGPARQDHRERQDRLQPPAPREGRRGLDRHAPVPGVQGPQGRGRLSSWLALRATRASRPDRARAVGDARGRDRPRAAAARTDPPLVRVRERRARRTTSASSSSATRSSGRPSRSCSTPRTPTSTRASWPSAAPASSRPSRSPRSRVGIGLGAHILLGRGEELTGGREKSSILADCVEAMIGAAYLSAGGRMPRPRSCCA